MFGFVKIISRASSTNITARRISFFRAARGGKILHNRILSSTIVNTRAAASAFLGATGACTRSKSSSCLSRPIGMRKASFELLGWKEATRQRLTFARNDAIESLYRQARNTIAKQIDAQFAATHAVKIDGVSCITGCHDSPRSRLA